MSNYKVRTLSEQGEVALSETPLGKGGEGSVYAVKHHSVAGLPAAGELVAKIYHEPAEGERANKVVAMLRAPAQDSSVAWPLAAVFTPAGAFAGYLMAKLHTDTYRAWAELAHARQRRTTAQNFDVRYALTAARNLAVAMASVHSAGHRVGDVNESNIFVGTDASVLLVDTDSAQIASTKRTYPCLVGKPEYTAPELSHGSLRDQLRTVESDVFAYAVAVFQMLTGGAHPTDAIFTGADEPPSTVDKIRGGIMPGLSPAPLPQFKPVPRIASEAIPARLRAALLASLSPAAEKRPGLPTLIKLLDSILANLRQCPRVAQHWYDERDGACGWCAHGAQGRPDPWAAEAAKQQAQVPAQTKLPTVAFGDSGDNQPQVRRAAPVVAGPPAPAAPSQPQPQQGYYGPPGQVQQQQPPGPQQPQYKGRKTVLNYADGTSRPRPPLGALFRANPKLAFSCLLNETPVWARAWWSQKRPVAHQQGLLLGLLVGLALSAAWLVLLPLGEQLLPAGRYEELFQTVYHYLTLAASATAALACLGLLLTGLWDRRKTKKRGGGSLAQYKQDTLAQTALRFPPLALLYGPVLMVALVGGLAIGLVQLLLSLIPSSRNI